MFCDLILSDLIGIKTEGGDNLEVEPMIPDDWTWFQVENLWYRGKKYQIRYDRDGDHFHKGSGLIIKSQ